ncbi:DUF5916 domain-containing protein [Lutibacter sp.]|uniref:carbohydrate binding family 9 domain-containing protein n=1 Tax=Lutibacter sp. TaxID=1925666 RepID=UPI0025BAC0DD|nr:DUF5916 domain-containing protein [Lutibacter sp.]MCF6167597.1 carbohydrate binding family 9 domain-containing protein [Lutibacter sp.]
MLKYSNFKREIFIILSLLYFSFSFAQKTDSNIAIALPITDKVTLDGKLNESIWKQKNSISNFIQREPDFEKPATERTKVAISYYSSTLYIAVWCYQHPSTKIIAKSLQRDFNFEGEDNFKIVINPFNDKRTGYEFIVNPYGARADLLITSSDNTSSDWNGVWDAVATITNEGWFVEIQIPFNTLKFKNNKEQIWGINFERNIASKNETDRWQGWSRDLSLENFTSAGTLIGLENISYTNRFELKPYLLGGWNLENDKISYNSLGKIGADLNYNITPTLKLNLTVNTDFAQVESDVLQINLTRFNLYYPEKREFFLEGAGNFDFYIGNRNNVFYSRNIGIENFQSVNVLGGARLFGKIRKSNIGFLSLQTAATDNIPTVNNSVFRYKYDVGKQSYIGGIITSKLENNHRNLVLGIDGNYTTSSFLKDKNLAIGALISLSANNGNIANNSLAYRLFIDYPNDLIDNYIGISSVQDNFSPELGFLSRTNFESFSWGLRFTPRWFNKLGIRKMVFKPWQYTIYRTQTTQELESYFNESRPFGFILKSGDTFEFNIQQSFDRIDKPFNLSDNISIGTGKYYMHAYEFQISSFQGRKFFTEILYNKGTFYNGYIKKITILFGLNINKHFNLTQQYENNLIEIDIAKDNIQQFISTLNYALNTKFNITLLSQYNSEEDQLLTNFRIHWIPKIGSDFYFVWNNGYAPTKQAEFLRPTINNGAAKFIWRFTF